MVLASANSCVRADRHVALKILTADSYGAEKDTFELSILEHIKKTDISNPGAKNILGLLDYFKHRGPNGEHACLIFKAMGPDLAAYRQLFVRLRIPIRTLKKITSQILRALAYLHQSCRVIHTGVSQITAMLCNLLMSSAITRSQTAEYSHRNCEAERNV